MLEKTKFRAMGCSILTVLDCPSPPDIFPEIPRWFDEWEEHLSRFRSHSELSKVNRSNGIPTRVSPIFADVLEKAIEAEKLSEGLVTPILLDALISAGYDRDFNLMPHEKHNSLSLISPTTQHLNEINWDPITSTLWMPPDLHLDFGGVGKGWAAHQTAQRLKKYGPCLVDAQGDIAVTAPQRDGSPWQIGIANPFESNENIAVLHIREGGVATSGRDARQWILNGKMAHHIIDPHTGFSAETDVLTATVIAPNVMQAETIAKTLLILGKEAALQWLDAHPGFAALLVLENGDAWATENIETYL